jgi:cobalt-zinc-cadmium efflux system outer membrane protein
VIGTICVLSASVFSPARAVDDPTIGLLGGKDENDNFVGVGVAIPLALGVSTAPFREASSQAALADQQRYLESYRLAESRLRNADAVYGNLFERWKQWRSLTAGRIDPDAGLPRRLWDAGEISSGEFLTMLKDREEARIAGIRLSVRGAWKAWIEWLASRDELEPWLRNLAGHEYPPAVQ